MPRTDTASRSIAASAERIYTALIDADALATWLPPQGMTGRFEHFDPQPGGSYRLILAYDDPGLGYGKATDGTDVVEAQFVSLEPGVRVVQAIDFESDDPAFAGTMTMTWELHPRTDGTLVDITATDVPPGISAHDHTIGMTSSLANLAAYVEE